MNNMINKKLIEDKANDLRERRITMKNFRRQKVYNFLVTILFLASIIISSIYFDKVVTNSKDDVRLVGPGNSEELRLEKETIYEKEYFHVSSVNLAVGEFLSTNNPR